MSCSCTPNGRTEAARNEKSPEPVSQLPLTYRPTAADRTKPGTRRLWPRIAIAFGGSCSCGAVDQLGSGKMTAQPFFSYFRHLAADSSLFSRWCVGRDEVGSSVFGMGRCVRCRFESAKATGGCGGVHGDWGAKRAGNHPV